MPERIAFLFLTIDNLKHYSVWEQYFNEADKNKYNIYLHPKNPDKVSDKLLKSSIIPELVKTEHGYLTEAMIVLMKEALKNKDNKYFCFVSDSCVPIKKFNVMYSEVFKIGKSIVGKMFLKMWDKKKRYVDAAKKVKKSEVIPKKCFAKFSQWSILIREDIEKIVISPYLKFFYELHAGDEFYLSILNCDKFEYKNLPATYVDWAISDEFGLQLHRIQKDLDAGLKKYNYGISEKDRLILKDIIGKLKIEASTLASHPRHFDNINNDDIKLLKETPAFFARKFSVDSNISNVIDKIW